LKPTVLVGLDARGFIFAPALALRLNIRFVPIRKRGKLPGECVQAKYVKEYGEDIFEMQKGRMTSSDRVVVVDDLIATGNCQLPFPSLPNYPFAPESFSVARDISNLMYYLPFLFDAAYPL
jgi:adenine phosphoribosyltransferase